MLSPKGKKVISTLLKVTIFALVFWYVYHLLTRNDALMDFKALLSTVNSQIIYTSLSIVLILMAMNWFVEALKWKYICQQFQIISLRKSIESVLCGLSWAIFTPNRIGEYGGRVLFLSPKKRVFGIIGMGMGSISQMVITNVVGVFAFSWFVYVYLTIQGLWFIGVSLLALVYAAFFLLLYFRIGLINNLLVRIKFLRKYQRFFGLLLRYDQKKLRKIFLYSAIRYVIFTSQYCLLMQVLIPNLPFFEMIMMVFILFFVQSALPSLDLFDVGVRSVTASYFFGFLTDQYVAVMAIAACIWFVNLIIPAIIGSFFTFKIKFFDTNNN
jgi:hypothetical protein